MEMGRPLKYTVEQLEGIITQYFALTDSEELTVTGLALLVGSKQLFNDYESRKEYRDMVRLAKLSIENAYELSLRKNGKAGDIFALKNFGWKDKTEVENTHLINSMPPVSLGDKKLDFLVGDEIEEEGADDEPT